MYSVVYCITSANGMTTAEIGSILTQSQAKFIATQVEASFSSFGRCKAIVVKVA
jgi:hypothetical protein